jgi:hypothetical protein
LNVVTDRQTDKVAARQYESKMSIGPGYTRYWTIVVGDRHNNANLFWLQHKKAYYHGSIVHHNVQTSARWC